MRPITKGLGAKILSIALSILLVAQYAFAAPVGKITYVEGRVDLLRSGSDMAVPLREGDEVAVGDAVRTKSNSKAEITFDDTSTVRLAQNSRVDITDYQLDENKRRKSANILVERGKARTIIAKMPDSAEFIISTPNAQGAVKGSDIFTTYQSGSSSMLVAEGRLAVSSMASPEKIVMVPAGNSVSVPLDSAPKDPRAYLELEKKLFESDTGIPPKPSAPEATGVIRGVIAKLSGDVRITKKGEASSRTAGINEILEEGDKVETGADGVIEIRFDNGNAMNLKPNSNVTIVSLVFNPQTGEYENLFESTAGRIKARIEKLKGKSKFEVRTPSSICGARGTIMYVNVLPNMTQTFFEGGSGYMTNIASGMTKVIGVGENAFSDASGNISDPNYTPEGERETFSEGWEPGSGTEGYSAPESSVSDYFDSTEGDEGGGPDAGGDGGSSNPIDIPFDPGAPPPPPSISLTATGSFLGDDASILTATIASVDTAIPSPWIGMEPFTVSGTYLNPNNETVWATDVLGTGVDGGSIQGWFGGSWHSWDGVLAALYIDPGGTNKKTGAFSHIAGFMFGYFTGTNSGGSFAGTSYDDPDTKDIIEGVVIVPVNLTTIEPENLSNNITTQALTAGSTAYGAFDSGSGYIDVGLDRTHMFITGLLTEDGDFWGIWKDSYSGTYRNPNRLQEWSSVAGGGYLDEGYHFTTLEGIDDLDGGLRVDMMGAYLSYQHLGSFLGTALGTYTGEEAGNFLGVGFGSYTETPLTSSGRFISSIYDDTGALTGNLSGLMGTTAADEPMVSIGTFTRNITEPFVWFSGGERGIYTYNPYNPDGEIYLTSDGGAFVGINAGFGQGNEMTGRMKALYVGPDDSIGILNADLSGLYSASSGAYMITGDITSKQIAEDAGITAAELYDSVFTTGGRGMLSGSFADGGALSAEESFTTMSIANTATGALGWGIYGQRFAGTFTDAADEWSAKIGGADAIGAYYSQAAEDFASDNGYWLADITGGEWSNGGFAAGLSGTFLTSTKMGTLSGDLFGIYDTDAGTWQGVGFGEWEGETLSLSGVVGDDNTPLLYYAEGESLTRGGTFNGILGSLTSPWSAETQFTAMGQYNATASGPFIFNTTAYSFNAPNNTYTTLDNGAFYGYSSGLWDTAGISGGFTGIYVDPDGNIGYLRAPISGSNFSGVNLWVARGIFDDPDMRIPAGEFGIDAGQLYDSIYETERRASSAGHTGGAFANGGSITGINYLYTLSIVNEAAAATPLWGVFSSVLFGDFSGRGGDTTWSGKAGGSNGIGAYYNEGEKSFYDDTGYWVADITNGAWDNGRISADINGTFLTATKTGTLSGAIAGTYDAGSGKFQSAGNGIYEGEALTLSGEWGQKQKEGSLYYNYNGSAVWAGSDHGFIGATTEDWWGMESFSTLAMGQYDINEELGNQPLIWNTSVNSYNAPLASSTTIDGGAFYGYTAGIWNNGLMDGSVAGIYISPDGDAGLLKGAMDGFYYSGTGMWRTEGSLTPYLKAAGLNVKPSNLGKYLYWTSLGDTRLAGAYSAEGEPTGEITGGVQESSLYCISYYDDLVNQHWGAYTMKLGGAYHNDDAAAKWSAKMGGDGYFGAYFGDGGSSSDWGYWSADISGQWQDKEVRGALSGGKYLTYTTMGSIEGDLWGIAAPGDYPTWAATSVGSWEGTPLTFSGIWGDADDCLYADLLGNGSASQIGDDYGLMGSTTENWWAQRTFPVFAMGKYWDDLQTDKYIWNTEIQSYNAIANNSTTLDGGAFYGFTAGLWKDGSLKGALLALFADENGNIGYLTSNNITGAYNLDISMWEAQGDVAPVIIEEKTGLAPEDFDWTSGSISNNGLFGTFQDEVAGSSGSITGYQHSGSYYSVLVDGEERDWGIFNFILGSGNTFSNPDEETAWEANMGGTGGDFNWLADLSGAWGDGEISGSLNADFISSTHLGTMSGALYGLDSKENTWIAAGMGTWERTPLSFSGKWGQEATSIYYNDEGYITPAGEDIGLIGSTAAEWWKQSSFQFLAIGGYSMFNTSENYFWNTPISSYNAPKGNSSTLDGGAFYGFTAGIWNNGIMDGSAVALYISPTDIEGFYNAGLLRGGISGACYSGLSMWKATGALAAEQLAEGLELDPAYFNSYITSSPISNRGLYGYFGEGSYDEDNYICGWQDWGYGYSIGEEPWGIFNMKLGDENGFCNPDPDENTGWTAVMGGVEKDESGFITACWFADLSGTWDEDEIRADVTGTTLSDGSLGIFDGNLFGAGDAETWAATIIGTYQDTELSFGGMYQGGFGYYDYEDGGVNLEYGDIQGLFGGTASLWAGSPSITFMGEFANEWDYNLWGADLMGGTADGAAILGVVGGTALNNSLKGILHALYIRPVEGGYRAGYLISPDIAGTFYPDTLDMFRATGRATHYLDLPTEFSPEQLFGEEGPGPAVESGEFGGVVAGDVQGTIAGEGINIKDQEWGLWRAGTGGVFAYTPSADWSANIGGVDMAGRLPVGYWVGTMTGSLWADGELAGLVSGRSLSLEQLQEFQGSTIGVYDDYTKTWEALSLGTYTIEPLSHVTYVDALVNTPEQLTTYRNEGCYKYYGDPELTREYKYYYYDNNSSGYSLDIDYTTGNEVEYYYYGDGKYRKGEYDAATSTWTYTTGTWDSETEQLSDLVSAWPNGQEPDETYSDNRPYNYMDLNEDEGNFFSRGLLGGVDAITWGEAVEAEFIGEYHPDADLSKPWISEICSYNYKGETPTTYDGGAYYGYLVGYSQQPAKAKFIALYIDPPDGSEISRAGYLSGDFDGTTYANINMLDLKGDLFAKQMTLDAGISAASLAASIRENSFCMNGSGAFDDGGQMQAFTNGVSLGIIEQRWGIWAAFMDGTYTEPEEMSSQNWNFALGGGSEGGGYTLGMVDGDVWSGGEMGGLFKGVVFSNNNDNGKIRASIVTGDVDGQYIEVDPGTGTWNAASAGEWVEVTELLTPEQLGFDAADLDQFVSVPITEVYSSMMTGAAPAMGILSFTMDLSLYATSQTAQEGIWAALCSANYSDGVALGWSVIVNGTAPGDAATITNTLWGDNQWLATVTGTAGGNSITGQVGGGYGNGALTGAGGGTWTNTPQ